MKRRRREFRHNRSPALALLSSPRALAALVDVGLFLLALVARVVSKLHDMLFMPKSANKLR